MLESGDNLSAVINVDTRHLEGISLHATDAVPADKPRQDSPQPGSRAKQL